MREQIIAALAEYDFTKPHWNDFKVGGYSIAEAKEIGLFKGMREDLLLPMYADVVAWDHEFSINERYRLLLYNTSKMREYQKHFFMYKGKTYFEKSKQFEKEVDKLLLLVEQSKQQSVEQVKMF